MELARALTDRWVLSRILDRQIASYRPAFVWLFSGIPVTMRELRTWRRHAEHIILWWSCPLKDAMPYADFDLILTGIPSLARYFEQQGIKVLRLSHAFDHRILGRVPCKEPRVPRVAFVGSLSAGHRDRISFLDALSRRVPIDFYGHGELLLPGDSPLRRSYRGPAWGDDLYSVYGSYLIVVHRNIDVAGRSASAKRLFEATGMGACVVTEDSEDIADLFTPNEEVLTYSDLDDCVTKIEGLLRHPEKARDIGKRGQTRTLKDHTYDERIQRLLEHLKGAQLR